MLSVYALKPAFQDGLRPLVRRLAGWGVTPNQVTVAAGAASVALGLDLAFGSGTWILLPLFLPVRMALNAMDGMLAREHQLASRTGAILNELLDVVSDAALALPFAIVPGVHRFELMLAVAGATLTEVAGFAGRGERRYHGPFGKSDRALALGIAGAWLGFGWPVEEWAAVWLPRVWILLCGLTTFNRLRVGARAW